MQEKQDCTPAPSLIIFACNCNSDLFRMSDLEMRHYSKNIVQTQGKYLTYLTVKTMLQEDQDCTPASSLSTFTGNCK